MWMLLTAIATASVLGSMHCVGMCGPLAIWASGAAENHPRRRVWNASALYHVGRLATYLLMGLIAGLLGQLVDLSGEAIGIQVAAARVAGVLMVAMGIYQLREFLPFIRRGGELQPSQIGGLLVKLRPYVFRLPLPARAFATGLLTTFLPCGWLYLFALVAAGTGSMVVGPVVMAAFWVGTVPALVGLVAGTRVLTKRFTVAIPAVASLLLVLTGCYTASGRGFASIRSLQDLQATAGLNVAVTSAADVTKLQDVPLPCCEANPAVLSPQVDP
ncbi:MAG: sulfite exporter TauE/SafE family protein [Rubripirellula sp.]